MIKLTVHKYKYYLLRTIINFLNTYFIYKID